MCLIKTYACNFTLLIVAKEAIATTYISCLCSCPQTMGYIFGGQAGMFCVCKGCPTLVRFNPSGLCEFDTVARYHSWPHWCWLGAMALTTQR